MDKRKGCVVLLALDLLLFGILFFSWNHTYGGFSRFAKEEVLLTDGGVEIGDGGTDTKIDGLKEKGKIALTFDDGPYPNYTRQLLEGLKKRNVKATFFILGKSAEEYPDVIETMYEDGHLIGNHTYHHVELTSVGKEEFKEEILSTNKLLYELNGEYPQFIRPPFGAWEKELETELGMIPVLWTVDPLDWCTENSSAVVQRVVTKVKENDIILMHDCYKSSVTAALEIVDILQAEGYEFVTVDEILLD
ncbi:MAG: polysaccharide deacetylase family protein [Roseburia sp.]|nr:polysaccharide deacetylase family protein [Roseburia sp.]MCM1279857.1 polysaccharide deacetylase family protein [Robinsoniella sp.]